MRHLILRNKECPGDLVMLSAAIRDLVSSYPGQYSISVDVNHPEIFENNPHVYSSPPNGDATLIECQNALINSSNQLFELGQPTEKTGSIFLKFLNCPIPKSIPFSLALL
jgi:hypothetical protein